MRSAVLDLDGFPSHAADRRAALRAAIRQLERADLYLGAVAAMDLGDRHTARMLARLRGDVDSLRHYLIELRTER